jgi:sugar lactone lactonase YvrE
LSRFPRPLHVERLDDRTLPSVSLAYVDDTWIGTPTGGQPTPDPVGGLVFGTNAFADIQSGINALTDGGTLVIYGGTYTYTNSVNFNKPLAAIQVATNAGTPAEMLVRINGPVTLTNSATFTETGATGLTFGAEVNGATPGTASLTVTGGNATTFNGPVGNTAALASLTTSAGGSTSFDIGTVTEFSVGITRDPWDITAGPDGNVWFTEYNGNRIGRITPAGIVTEFTATANSYPDRITAGPDGNLWFTENNGRIGRITPAGVVTEFADGITANSGVLGIAAGPDGNLWFTEYSGNRIGRITPAGVVTEFSAGISAGAYPMRLTAGPDGSIWFTEMSNRVGRFTAGGTIATSGAQTYNNAVILGSSSWPGVVTVNGSFSQSPTGTLAIELSGTAARTQYDQLAVNGTVNLAGATLAASLGSGFNPPVGTAFTIIDNDGTDAVAGTFAGLPQGAVFSIGGQSFSISYSGGTGNDVVLTRSSATAPAVVASVIVNAGQANLNQRSIVTNVTVTFDRIVDFAGAAEAAFQLARTGPGGTLGNVLLSVNLSGSTATQTVAKLAFSGALTEGSAATPSLIDGNYSLTVFSGQVLGGVQGGDSVTSLFRLYGDVNGDKAVNGLDLTAFRSAFGAVSTDTNYASYLDFNGDGAINGTDLTQFRSRFGIILP